jgi:hypothetical protein
MGSYRDRPVVTIYDMLDIVRERPGMWFGASDIENLFVWIQGFRAGTVVAGDPVTLGDPNFGEFDDWVAGRLGRTKSGYSWAMMLTEACGGDPERAFERFWVELDAFRASRGMVH